MEKESDREGEGRATGEYCARIKFEWQFMLFRQLTFMVDVQMESDKTKLAHVVRVKI
jgi:hypothetical protein